METSTNSGKGLTWWMRIVGSLYIFMCFAATILKMPIKVIGPKGTLELAASGDAMARFVEDSWVILGLLMGSIGLGLWMSSSDPRGSKNLVRTVLGMEIIWGIGSDIYQLTRGHQLQVIIPWILIHLVVIITGWLALRKVS